jgi:hypothetical protein
MYQWVEMAMRFERLAMVKICKLLVFVHENWCLLIHVNAVRNKSRALDARDRFLFSIEKMLKLKL